MLKKDPFPSLFDTHIRACLRPPPPPPEVPIHHMRFLQYSQSYKAKPEAITFATPCFSMTCDQLQVTLFFNSMFYKILCVKHSCSSIQSWGSVLPSIVEKRDQNSWGCPLLFLYHSVHRENLRSENKIKFKCPFRKIAKIRKSPFYKGVDLWNSLKVQQHRAENKKRFKNVK